MPEREPTTEKLKIRPLRIAIDGALGTDKTTLACLLGERWGVKPIEERFEENPYLGEFYADPTKNGISFKCQLHFLGLKGEDMTVHSEEQKDFQITSSTAELIEIFVPSMDANALYGKVHRDMDFMDAKEWDMYKRTHTFLTRDVIVVPDFHIVLNAPAEVLYERIINERGRDFEQRKFFEKYHDYLPRLVSAVSEWAEKAVLEHPVLVVDSANNDFSDNTKDKEKILEQIENEIKDFLSENDHGKDGLSLIFPEFLKAK